MFSKQTLSWTTTLFVLAQVTVAPAATHERTIIGTVVEQKKYSIVVSNGVEEWQVFMPPKIPVQLVLERTKIDLEQNQITFDQLYAKPENSHSHTHHFDIRQPLMIEIFFDSDAEYQRFLADPEKRASRYHIFHVDPTMESLAKVPVPHDVAHSLRNLRTLTAPIVRSTVEGKIIIEIDGKNTELELGIRDGRLDGFSINDLIPFQTTIEATAVLEDDKWVAQSVLFRRIVDPITHDNSQLPRMLLLGDEISLNYSRHLQTMLRDEYNFHRPGENCRGSSNFHRLDDWLGPHDHPGRQWDVIVFNVGMNDLDTPTEVYVEQLKKWIERLQQTSARLIWMTTTPLPNGYIASTESHNPQEKLLELNLWANIELGRNRSITICDLNKLVTDGRANRFAEWWRGDSRTFNQREARWLAEHIANSIRAGK